MAFPINTVFLIVALVLSIFPFELESRGSFINYKPIIESSGVEVTDTLDPLETAVGQIRIKLKSEAAIREIHKYASLSVERGVSSIAVGVIEEGLKAAIELITVSSETADKAFVSVLETSCDNPAAAIQEIQKAIRTAQQMIYAAEFPVYYSFEAAGVIMGDSLKKCSKLGLEFAQRGATYAIASLNAAGALSINGLRSNSAAAIKGIDAAQETVLTGYEAAIASLVLGGKAAFKEMNSNYITAGINEKDKQICKTQLTTQSAESIAAESAIKYTAKQALESISQGATANAIYKIEKGLTCGIEATARGEISALRAISIAKKLAKNETDIAIATFNAGIKALRVAIINAANKTYQGLDEAAIILGNQNIRKFVCAVLKVQNGITSALADIESVEKLASIGLNFGGDVAEQGLKTAYKSVLAILFVFYSLLVSIGEEAF